MTCINAQADFYDNRRRRRCLFRILHARGAIPHEMRHARCRATPALTSKEEELAWSRRICPSRIHRINYLVLVRFFPTFARHSLSLKIKDKLWLVRA